MSPTYDFVPELTVAAADAGVDFTSQNKIPRAVIHTGGGVITYTDATGVSRDLHAVAGRAYPATIRTITNVTGEGYLQFFERADELPGSLGPVGPAGPGYASWNKPAVDGAASTATALKTFHRFLVARDISKIWIIPDAALVANDTNYATITVSLYSALGALVGVISSVTTKITGGTGDWVAQVAFELTVSTSYDNAVAGELLEVEITKAAAGVAVPAMLLQVDFVQA